MIFSLVDLRSKHILLRELVFFFIDNYIFSKEENAFSLFCFILAEF